MNTINLFGLDICNITLPDAVQKIKESAISKIKTKIFFLNADCCNIAIKDIEYNKILKQTHYLFADGIGLKIASLIINDPIIDNVNGTDMFPLLCQMCIDCKLSMFLLGAKPGITDMMISKLNDQYSGLKIAGIHHGYFDHVKDNDTIIRSINNTKPDILLVAFGVPGQEKWIHRNFDKLDCSVAMGVGGLFDFNSGVIPRAPLWIRKIGMEWFYRFLQEPGRLWKRYLIGNPLFIFRVLKWRLLK